MGKLRSKRDSSPSKTDIIIQQDVTSPEQDINPRKIRSKRCDMGAESMPNDFVLVRCASTCTYSDENLLTDAMGNNVHFKCIHDGCTFESHCKSKNHYLEHRLRCAEKRKGSVFKDEDLTAVHHYVRKVIPSLQTLTNLPATRYIWLIRTMKELRPNVPSEVLKSHPSKSIQ